MTRMLGPDDQDYYATFATEQLRTLAASTNPAHIAYGLMAQVELIKRGEL